MKRYLGDLVQDPNYPGLRVCDPGRVREGCKDQFDPYRLAPRQTEKINLPFNRPDADVSSPTGDYAVDSFGSLQPPTQGDYTTVLARAFTTQLVKNGPLYFIVDSQGNIVVYTPAPGTAQ